MAFADEFQKLDLAVLLTAWMPPCPASEETKPQKGDAITQGRWSSVGCTTGEPWLAFLCPRLLRPLESREQPSWRLGIVLELEIDGVSAFH